MSTLSDVRACTYKIKSKEWMKKETRRERKKETMYGDRKKY